jgi:hypothetical protein
MGIIKDVAIDPQPAVDLSTITTAKDVFNAMRKKAE